MTLSDLQREANFPLIASATALIDRRLRQGSYDRVLLSSRDCYMQAHLWRRMFPATPYEVCYWMTSRWARIKGSEAYLDYCRGMLAGKVLVFDLCGSGESLRTLFERVAKPDYFMDQRKPMQADYLILQSDPRKNPHRLLDGPGDLEGLNCAPHASILDVTKDYQPVYDNSQPVDWWTYFKDIGGLAFMERCHAPAFSDYIDAPNERLLRTMRLAEATIAESDHLFEPFHEMRRREDWQ